MFSSRFDTNTEMVLRYLAQGGAMSPSEISARTLILPGETLKLLKNLAGEGLVIMRDSKESADGMLVTLSPEARNMMQFSSSKMYK